MKYSIKRNNTIRKPLAAMILAVIVSMMFSGLFETRKVYADEPEGYWKYTDSEVHGPSSKLEGSTMSGGHGHYSCEAVCEGDYYLENHDGSCRGETASMKIEVDEPPMTTLKPGQEVTMKVSASVSASTPHDGVLGSAVKISCNMGTNEYHNSEIDFVTADGVEELGIGRTWDSNDYYGYGGHLYVIGGDQTFRATVPAGRNGQTLWIRHTFQHGRGEDAIETYYYYEWIDTSAATVPTSAVGGNNSKQTEAETEPEEDDKKIDIVVDSDADANPGDQDGGFIPAGIVEGWKTAKDVAGAAGGVAAATALIALGLTDKKKKYRMAIYKDFGDTVHRGEKVYVYACIMERDEQGNEKVNHELTRQINIFSEDGVFDIYEQDELAGEYKGARVLLGRNENNREEGVVSFKFTGKGGTYTNRMKFKIDEPAIVFYQDNIALPAGYEKHEPLPFTLKGFNPDKVKIKVETTKGSSYEAELAPSDIPGTYFAVLTDVDRSRQEAGTVATSFLCVTAEEGGRTCTQSVKLLRVNEGINVALPALNCFRAPLQSAAGKTVEQLTKEDFAPATTTAKVILVLFNEEEHTIDQMPVMPEFEYIPVDPDPVVKQRVDELGLEAKLTKVEPGYSEITFFCTKAYLEPPCRFRIKLKARATYEGKVYTCEKEVLMRSQPVRLFRSSAEESAAAAADKEVARKLNTMLNIISHNNWEDELTGEILIARLLLDYYDWFYGYDALLTYQVLDNFYQFLENKNRSYLIDQYKALREADYERDDFFHELECRTRFLDSWGGIAVRIGLAIGTGGWSEAAFLAMDVNRAVVRYNDATPKEKRTTWNQVKAGSVPVLIWAAFAGAGKLASSAVPKLGVWASNKIAGSKLMPQSVKNAAEKVGKYFSQTAENVKNCDPSKLAQRASNAERAMNAASSQGEAEASALLKSMSGDLNALEKLMAAAQKAGDKEGAALLKELKLAVDTYMLSGKAPMAEGALKNNIIKLCQNKFAIEQLIKESPGQANIYRKLITGFRNKFFYDPVKKDSCKYIADMLNCDPSKITIKSVSGNSAEALEKGIAFGHDLDVTFVYKNGNTVIEIPQSIAEEALYKTTCRHAGIEFSSMAEARAAADKLQIHACQPKDAERLPEVQKFLDKVLRTEAVETPSVGKFINAETYKTVMPFKNGMNQIIKSCPDAQSMEALTKQLNLYLAGKGSLNSNMMHIIEGVGNIKDAYRFLAKCCNIIKNKSIGATIVGGNSGLSQSFHTVDGVAKHVASGNVSIATGFKLANNFGGFENFATVCVNQIDQVNTILQNGAQAGIGNAVPAVSGAVGVSAINNAPNP